MVLAIFSQISTFFGIFNTYNVTQVAIRPPALLEEEL